MRIGLAKTALGTLSLVWRAMSERERRWLLHSSFANRSAPARSVAGFAQRALTVWKFPWTVYRGLYDLDCNGETELLRRLASFMPRTVFDVGANRGDWAMRAATLLPGATIHAFEICVDTAAELSKALAPLGRRAIVNNFGLAETSGTVAVSTFANSSVNTMTPLGKRDHGMGLHAAWGDANFVMARVETGDRYVEQADIERINLLKVDVEGAEGRVLSGFTKTLCRGAIDVIQVEYNECAIWSRFLLRDLYELLVPFGFRLGRLGPNGVAFKDYAVEDEDFCGPNYVAVHGRREDMIAALRCEPFDLE
ncbi:MAG: FkbM family methyltransferase [Elioraea sp.]|nr:FkbM family methyltransferase [Elioraea sp.]